MRLTDLRKHVAQRGLFAAVIAVVGLTAIPVGAKGLSQQHDQCFGRVYTSQHMNKHPKQMVRMIHLAHRMSASGNQQAGKLRPILSVQLRTGSKLFFRQLECEGSATAGRCLVECDGGGFSYRFQKNGSLLIDIRKDWGVVLGSACDAGGQLIVIGERGGDDRLFRLDPQDAGTCP